MARRKADPDRFASLGFEAVEWIEHYLCHGPGDVQGEPLLIDDEMAAFIVKAYQLDPISGRRVVNRAFLSRPKGRAKSELAGALVAFEALGPCRFDGWDAEGNPVGRPQVYPFIRCLATEENQSGNTYDNVTAMLTHLVEEFGDEFPGIDLGRSAQTSSRIFIEGGGEIVPSTSSGASKDGGKETFAVFDEPMALDTLIPTTDGWKQIMDLEAGDRVFGVDGRPVLVYGVAPIKHGRPCFQVTFDDGESVVTDGSHRWHTFDRKSTKRWAEWTTQQMADANWYGGKRFAVAQPAALELDEADLPLDPYALGLWLGDGDERAAKLTVGRDDLDYVLAELGRLGFTTSVYDYSEERGAVAVRFNHGARYGKAGTSQGVLRSLGVLGGKRVPDLYLWASREQRLALLQGLMDSDGYVNERGNCIFTSTSRALADAVVHLVRSLGWRTTTGHWASDERWKSRTTGTWRVSFTPSGMVPFRMKRKADRCRLAAVEKTRAIASIEAVESVPVRCIAVDSDDHLFLAGESMLPTHNTHLYVLPELRAMHKTVRRNLVKRRAAEPWSLETSTMYAVGESSVAEATHEYAKAVTSGRVRDGGLLFDHREAPHVEDLHDDAQLLPALEYVYGDAAGWMDLERIASDMREPDTDPADARRYFLNQPGTASAKAFDPVRWRELADSRFVVPAKEAISIGFDGSKWSDSTGFVATHLETGHQWVLGVWEAPANKQEAQTWEVPEAEVHAILDDAMKTWRVERVYADPAYYEETIAGWAGKYGAKVVVEWWTHRPRQMAFALRAYRTAMTGGELSHDGSDVFARHIANAVKRNARVKDDEGKPMWTIQKDRHDSPRKIDLAMAGCLSWEARRDAIKDGSNRPRVPRRTTVMR